MPQMEEILRLAPLPQMGVDMAQDKTEAVILAVLVAGGGQIAEQHRRDRRATPQALPHRREIMEAVEYQAALAVAAVRLLWERMVLVR